MPRISICIPSYNAGALLQPTLDSVWAQDYDDFEVVVVDDASSDDSRTVLAAQTDKRLKVWHHAVNEGQARTVDDTILYATGDLIKFLDNDDLLHPECVSKMVSALDAYPQASFVVSRREIIAEQPDSEAVQAWIATNSDLHAHYGELGPINDGREMLLAWVAEGMASNWLAEPAGVMARRACINRIGGRSRQVRVISDMDFWARMMTCGDVAFIDEPLYSYRFALTGLTAGAAASDRHWLDPLWGAEGILSLPSLTTERRELRHMRYLLTRRALRRAVTELATAKPGAILRSRELLRYAGHRANAAIGRAQPLFAPMDVGAPPPAPSA